MIIFWLSFSEFDLQKTLLVNYIEKFGTRIRFSKDPAPIDLVCDFPKTVNLTTDFTAQPSYWLKNSNQFKLNQFKIVSTLESHPTAWELSLIFNQE